MQLLKWAAVELKPIKRTALKAVVSARHSGRRFMTHFNVLDAWRCQSETTRNVSTAKNSFDVYKVVTPSLPSANIWIITLKECFSLSLFNEPARLKFVGRRRRQTLRKSRKTSDKRVLKSMSGQLTDEIPTGEESWGFRSCYGFVSLSVRLFFCMLRHYLLSAYFSFSNLTVLRIVIILL